MNVVAFVVDDVAVVVVVVVDDAVVVVVAVVVVDDGVVEGVAGLMGVTGDEFVMNSVQMRLMKMSRLLLDDDETAGRLMTVLVAQ